MTGARKRKEKSPPALEKYRNKRNFSRTKEPFGEKENQKRSERLRYVVQKHNASHLHYDFRLELEGTLKSWAVPKGPALDPAVKRLAIHVEDHPLEYGTFEGIIPPGQYGAGTVMVWDRGVWLPQDKSPLRAYQQGKLTFILSGEKLHGSWVLFRTKAKGKQDTWLLRKNDDEFAVPLDHGDVLEQEPDSVQSGLSLEQLTAGARVQEKSDRNLSKRRDGLRKNLPFQLATLTKTMPPGDDWIHEVKLDGYRIQARVADGSVILLSRNGIDYTEKFPRIAKALEKLPVDEAILGGEIAIQDSSGRTNFQLLQNSLAQGDVQEALYFAFDLLQLNGKDLRNIPLLQRKARLKKLFGSKQRGRLVYHGHLKGRADQIWESACDMGLEGLISKRREGKYAGGRTRDWRKVKCQKRQEFVIGGFAASSNKSYDFGALLIGYFNADGELQYAGRVGTGFTAASRRELARKLKKIETSDSPFDEGEPVQARGVTWVKPVLVGEVEFTEWTADGRLRHPSFQGLRDDKPPRAVRREEAEPTMKDSGIPQDRKGKSVTVDGVTLTNAGRSIFPGSPVTKEKLVELYTEFADFILPHMQHRPLVLVRCPKGGKRRCFFQKHATESIPDSIPRVTLRESDGDADYLAIKNLDDLLELIQLNTVEFHSWGSRSDKVERPDRLIFDLDPSQELPWSRVAKGAETLRKFLQAYDLESYPKLTGGKGIHLVVPLIRRYGWEDLKEWAHFLAKEFCRLDPSGYTSIMSLQRRKGKIFIDYLRNGRGASSILSYSPRAKPGTPFAVPIQWSELSRSETKFFLEDLRERLSGLKTDPWSRMKPQSLKEVKASYERWKKERKRR